MRSAREKRDVWNRPNPEERYRQKLNQLKAWDKFRRRIRNSTQIHRTAEKQTNNTSSINQSLKHTIHSAGTYWNVNRAMQMMDKIENMLEL